MHNEYLKGALLTALGVTILSFDALLIRLIDAHSFGLIFWRGCLLSLVVYIWCKQYRPAGKIFQFDAAMLRSAALFAISSFSFVSAIKITSAANVLVIISATPMVSAVLAHIFLKEKSPPVTWIAIFFCMGGIVWVLKDGWHSGEMLGDMFAVLCCLGISAKFVNDRHARSRDMTPALILAGIMMAVIAAGLANPFIMAPQDWVWIFALCVVVLPSAFILITLGPMRIPAAEVSMMMLLETALGPLWVWLILQEVPPTSTLQGGSVVILTLLAHSILRWRKQP